MTEDKSRAREEIDGLIKLVEEEAKKGRRVSVGCLFPIGCLSVIFAAGPCTWVGLIHPALPLVVLTLLGGWLYFLAKRSLPERQRKAAQILTGHRDLRVVGPLLEALYWPDMEPYAPGIEDALIQMLPQMKASDAGMLSTHQRQCLHKALRRWDDSFVCAVLTWRSQNQRGNPASSS